MTRRGALRWPRSAGYPDPARPRIGYGADYNPEQWPRATWREDVELMRAAGVNIVNLAIFGWARLQPGPDEWDFDWLDEIIELLHGHGIAVDLGTATASPPPWLTARHPEILPVDADGTIRWPGGRQHWRPTSPIFRAHAYRLVTALAERYGRHPALALWHVSNELGCHNALDYSDDAAAAFRDWLRVRYGSLEALNDAWGTAFWSQRYTDWAQLLPPRQVSAVGNPTQQLDFHRFSSDALLDYLRGEVRILHELSPDVPVTTNFMVLGETKPMDYAGWVDAIDVVSNDHYLTADLPDNFDELCFCANLTSGLAGARPWLLMEHSTSAVNWQPVNPPKAPGQLQRDSLAHLAHGADLISFFQWRQSVVGAEKYHSAMLPHAGTDSPVWRASVELGRHLAALAELAGSTPQPSSVAIVHDWPSWWGAELDSHPNNELRYRRLALDWYRALRELGVAVDVVPLQAELASYRMVVTPTLYLVGERDRQRLGDYVGGGGHLVTTFFSGIVDADDRVYPGGYPGALRELLGVRVAEFGPLLPGVRRPLAGGGGASMWAEEIELVDPAVEVLASYLTGPPAVTRRRHPAGSASYVGARLDPSALRAVLVTLLDGAGVRAELDRAAAAAITARTRVADGRRYTFLLNHSDREQWVPGVAGDELLTGASCPAGVAVAPYGAAVVRHSG